MAEINDLSITDGSNTARFPENMAPSAVNDGARALEGILARGLKDTIDGIITTGGTSTAYTAAANRTITAYYDGLQLTLEFHTASGATPTLNVDSVGAQSLVWPDGTAVGSGEIPANLFAHVIYDETNTNWIVLTTTALVTAPSAASDSAAGIVELATDAEVATGTDTARAITPAGAKSAYIKQGLHSVNLPAGAWKPQTTNGAAAPESTEAATNDVMTTSMAFDASTIEYAQISFRLPPSADHTATLSGEIEWTEASGATSHDVVWQIEAQAQGDGDTIDSSWGTAVTCTDTGTSGTRRFIAFSGLTPGGTPAAGDKYLIRLSRKATDGSDTLDVDALFIEMQLYITINASDDA